MPSEGGLVGRLVANALAALAFFATVGGTFLTIFAPEHLRLLWLALPASVVFAALRVLGPSVNGHIRAAVRKVRSYDKDTAELRRSRDSALRTAAENIAKAADLAGRLEQLEADVESAFERGTSEGRRRAVTEIAAVTAGTTMKLDALVYEKNALLFIAELTSGDAPTPDSRFILRIRNTRAKAALRVLVLDHERGGVMLGVDEVVDLQFMEGLTQRVANGNPDPPAGLTISARTPLNELDFLRDDWDD
jgi:hypothetical protein